VVRVQDRRPTPISTSPAGRVLTSRSVLLRFALASLLGGTALASTPALAVGELSFASTIDAIEFRPEVGTGIYGVHLTGNFGVTSIGVRLLDHRWLISWSGDGELVLGGVAYELTAFVIYGVQGEAHAEGGLRLMETHALSPYVSAGSDGRLSAITQWGNPFNDITINNLDGLGGIVGTIDFRLGGGASFLDARQSLVLEVQPFAEFDGSQPFRGEMSYFGAALHARYDLMNALTAVGEASIAFTPTYGESPLGTSADTNRWVLSGSAIKKWTHWSCGLGLSVSRASTRLTYDTGQSYTSNASIDSRFWLLFGFWP
jgi:hypothetical protein